MSFSSPCLHWPKSYGCTQAISCRTQVIEWETASGLLLSIGSREEESVAIFFCCNLNSFSPPCPREDTYNDVRFTHLVQSSGRASVWSATPEHAHVLHSVCMPDNSDLFFCSSSLSPGRILELARPPCFLNKEMGPQKGGRVGAPLPIKSAECLRLQLPNSKTPYQTPQETTARLSSASQN